MNRLQAMNEADILNRTRDRDDGGKFEIAQVNDGEWTTVYVDGSGNVPSDPENERIEPISADAVSTERYLEGEAGQVVAAVPPHMESEDIVRQPAVQAAEAKKPPVPTPVTPYIDGGENGSRPAPELKAKPGTAPASDQTDAPAATRGTVPGNRNNKSR